MVNTYSALAVPATCPLEVHDTTSEGLMVPRPSIVIQNRENNGLCLLYLKIIRHDDNNGNSIIVLLFFGFFNSLDDVTRALIVSATALLSLKPKR